MLGLITLGGLASCEKIRQATSRLAKKPASAKAAVHPNAAVTELTNTTYAAFRAQPGKLVIIDFYADWCGPCRKLGPHLEKIAAEHPGRVVIGKVNIDQCPELAAKEGARSIPDVRLVRDGKVVDQFVGFPGESAVRNRIAGQVPLLSSAPAPARAPAPAPAGATAPQATPPSIQRMPKNWVPPTFKRD